MSRRSRSEQARINGAKSRGPKTPEGKAVSSTNALRHGRRAKSAPAAGGEPAFLGLLNDYIAHLAPRSAVESALVRHIASADWQLARWRAVETALLDRLYERARPIGPDPNPIATLTCALEASVNESHLLVFIVHRIATHLADRTRALRALLLHRQVCPLVGVQPQSAPRGAGADNFFVFAEKPQIQSKATDSKPVGSPQPKTNEPKSNAIALAAVQPQSARHNAGAGNFFSFAETPEIQWKSSDSKPVTSPHPKTNEPKSNSVALLHHVAASVARPASAALRMSTASNSSLTDRRTAYPRFACGPALRVANRMPWSESWAM